MNRVATEVNDTPHSLIPSSPLSPTLELLKETIAEESGRHQGERHTSSPFPLLWVSIERRRCSTPRVGSAQGSRTKPCLLMQSSGCETSRSKKDMQTLGCLRNPKGASKKPPRNPSYPLVSSQSQRTCSRSTSRLPRKYLWTHSQASPRSRPCKCRNATPRTVSASGPCIAKASAKGEGLKTVPDGDDD